MSSSSIPSSSPGPEWIAAVGAKPACITLSSPWVHREFYAGLRDELLDGDLLFAQASEDRDRELAMPSQHRAPALVTGLQTAGAGSLRARICRAGNDAIPTISAARAGSEADHALTLKLDPSLGTDHLFKEAYHIHH